MKANDKVDELDQLLILAKKSELAVLVKLYAEKNPLFRKEVTRYLDAKYKSAATTSNYRKLMKEAFKQTIVSGTYYHRLEETDWPAVRLKANELLEEGQKLLAVGNAAAAAGIGIQFFASLKENISEAAFEGDDEGLDTGQCCTDAGKLITQAFRHPALTVGYRKAYLKELKALGSSRLPSLLTVYGMFDFHAMQELLS